MKPMAHDTELPKLLMTEAALAVTRAAVAATTSRWRFKTETGVALFGARLFVAHVAFAAVGPGPEAIYRRTLFEPDADYLNAEFERLKMEWPGLAWLGSLHLHPPGLRRLSAHDRRTVETLLSDEALGLPDFVAGILQRHGTRLSLHPYLIERSYPTPRQMRLAVISYDDPLVEAARRQAGGVCQTEASSSAASLPATRANASGWLISI